MVVIKRLSGVPILFGGEEHSGWLPADAVTPPPTPVEKAMVDFEISAAGGGYLLEWHSQNTNHRGDLWFETLEDAMVQAKIDWGIPPDRWQSAERGSY